MVPALLTRPRRTSTLFLRGYIAFWECCSSPLQRRGIGADMEKNPASEDAGYTQPALSWPRISKDHRRYFPTGTRRFNSSNQFSTTLICVGAAPTDSLGFSIRKRWPSGETS
jgi:hypothetical protein